jgi:hypothetical protein
LSNSFSATISNWAKMTERAIAAVFKEAAQDLAIELNNEVKRQVYDRPPAPTYPKRSGFLRASLVASTEKMPELVRDNPGGDFSEDAHMPAVLLTIQGMDGDNDVLYLGYTSRYAAYVHYGANGAPPAPWVTLVAQRWQELVTKAAERVKRQYGL